MSVQKDEIMVFLIFFACTNAEQTITSGSQNKTETVDSPSTLSLKSEEGRTDAEKSLLSGTIHILTFGEEMPPDTLDRQTGLPLQTMGCDFSEEEDAYVRSYNDTMKEWLKKNTPFPQDMEILFSSSHLDIKASYRVTPSSVEVKEHGTWKTLSSLVSQRMKIGILAQRSMNVHVPASLKKDGASHFLSVQTKKKKWSMSWSEAPPEPVRVTVDSILELR